MNIKKYFSFSALAVLFLGVAFMPSSLIANTLDKSHTSAHFTATHLGFAKVTGSFDDITANIDLNGDNIKSFKAVAKTASVDTKNAKRDNHLRSGDFFDAKKNPEITLEMISHDKNSMMVNITIRGITKKVKFDLAKGLVKAGSSSVFGMNLSTTLNRKDFNLGNSFAAKVISEDIRVELSFEFKLAK